MKSLSASVRSDRAMGMPLRIARRVAIATLALGMSLLVVGARAQTVLADRPLFSTNNVPGNLALLLSVEFPTAVSVAHTSRSYTVATEYLGYFDPNKCYSYRYTDGTGTDNYFEPAGTATGHACSGKWSGNFLNWATMQTIDPFRWALTGGYRVIDTSSLTVIEKASATGQGGTGNFPDSFLGSTLIAGATPFPSSTSTMSMRIQGLGNKMRFAVPVAAAGTSFVGNYYNNQTLSGGAVLTRTDPVINFNWDNSQPDPLVNQSNMSVEWNGTITAPTTGAYTFRMRADDTLKLWVNGNQDINQTAYDGLTNHYSQTYNATAGDTITIKVQFSQGYGGSSVVLEWLKPGTTSYEVVNGATPSLYNTATPYPGNSTTTGGVVYEVFVRAKVCDPSAIETNCTAYGSNYKPEGLLQKYANKIRYSAFGYLNDSDIKRDGGVLRAQQKFVGPTQPVPGSSAITNAGREWDASTGIFTINPDTTDATNTSAIWGTVSNSGVLNYLNKFGEVTPGSYKTYDNVSELYYAAVRYFKALPDVPEWTAVGTASATTRATWADGFPVITSPADPILYACQRNFILGIGDVNTHADKNLPGRLSTQSGNEPLLPTAVSNDTSVNAVTATDTVGSLEGLTPSTIGSSATYNTPAIAGLAFDSHINDIRPDDTTKPNTAGKQTIDTYWVDVQEYQQYATNNQFYLATKYGGFTVPAGYNSTMSLTESWWHTNTDSFNGQKRPDNYFSGGRPDLMKAGLDAAFAKISAEISAYTTSFSTSLPQVALTGNSSFSSKYDPNTWTGEITASELRFDDTTGEPQVQPAKWNFSDVLATQLSGTGWDTNRRVVSWNGSAGVAFRASGTSQLAAADVTALDTAYVTGNDSVDYLNYLRGQTKNELNSTESGSTHAYRSRVKLIGDIVGSKARPVGAPSFPFSDATNAGYSTFKTTWANRRTVVYVGANDGMMHAINGALVTSAVVAPAPALEVDAAAGTEMFAYVPRALFQGPTAPDTDGLASLGKTSFTHHYMVNATPSVYDIDLAKTPGGSGAANWRSVLIGGMGKGGRGYYAIDVTDPQTMASATEATVASKVLWEFTSANDSALGYTFGDPVVVKTKQYGWVVIVPSGYNNADGKGYLLFINPRTGALLQKVSTGVGSTTNSAGLAHANAFVVDATDGTADAVYAGDLLGNLWRFDVTAATGTYPAPTKIAVLADSSGNAQPVTSRPSIEVHPGTKKRYVLVGTGRLLDTTDIASTRVQSFYAIADGTNAGFNATGAPSSFPYSRTVMAENTSPLRTLTGTSAATLYDPATQVGWYEDLGVDSTTTTPAHTGTGIAWRVTTDSTTLSGSVAFAATLPNGSVCSPSGDSRVYGRDYAEATTTVKSLVGTTLTPVAFVSLSGNVTDLRYLSVRGKATLISGTDTGAVSKIDINPGSGVLLRRLNWRELQLVD